MRLPTTADVTQQPWLLDQADAFTQLLHVQHGVLTTGQALRFLSRSALRHRVASGRWQAAHRGIYVVHNGRIDERQRLWVAVLAAGTRAVLAGRTALAQLGLKGFAPRRIDILLPGQRREGDPPEGVVVHRAARLSRRDVHPFRLPACTTAGRAVVDAAGWAGTDDEARTVIAMAFQQRLVRLDEIHAVVSRLTRTRRRRLIIQCASDADGGAHALGELVLLRQLRSAGLPEPTRQRERVDASGRRRYLDLFWEEYGLHVEIDGSHHLDPRQAWQDMVRHNDLYVAGERLLRYPVWLVREQPRSVLGQIRTALIAAGWSP